MSAASALRLAAGHLTIMPAHRRLVSELSSSLYWRSCLALVDLKRIHTSHVSHQSDRKGCAVSRVGPPGPFARRVRGGASAVSLIHRRPNSAALCSTYRHVEVPLLRVCLPSAWNGSWNDALDIPARRVLFVRWGVSLVQLARTLHKPDFL
jgi:hypothetical protein